MAAPKRKKSAQKPATTATATAKKATASQKPIRREVGSLVCFLLGLFSLLYMFGVRAFFLNFLGEFLRGMLGYGFFVAWLAFFFASMALLFHRGKPVKLRIFCLTLFPIIIGSLFHVLLSKQVYTYNVRMFPQLYVDGQAMKSAGALSGFLSESLSVLISKIGAGFVLFICIIALILVIFRLSVVTIYDNLRARKKRIYEVTPPSDKLTESLKTHMESPVKPSEPPFSKKAKRSDYDIPIYLGDDEAKLKPPQKAAEPPVSPVPFETKPIPVNIEPKPTELATPAEILNKKKPPFQLPQVFHFDKPTYISPETGEIVDVAEVVDEDIDEAELPIENIAESNKLFAEPRPVEVEPVVAMETPVLEPPQYEVTKPVPPPYKYPPVSLLNGPKPGQAVESSEDLRASAHRLIEVLNSFGIGAKLITITKGPTVSRFELELETGTKLSSLTNLSNDIALSLGAPGVNISPVQSKANVVGVEVPNKQVSVVYARDVMDSQEFQSKNSPTTFAVGRDISGQNIVGDIAKLTHLLIAGTTGSGKSVCMNTLIISLLYKASPEDVRLIMVDPKMVELGIYNGIPHLLVPVVTDMKKAAAALEWAVVEMERRFALLMERGKRDIDGYNESIKGEPGTPKMPRIIVIIDEMADLMMIAKKEIETSVARIAQKARACGVHLILATQRPTAQVVTGIIKANTPSRIAFAVASNLDSRIILDQGGAEKLIGKGDMMYFPVGAPKPNRVQGCFISDDEVAKIVEFIKNTYKTEYASDVLEHLEKGPDAKVSATSSSNSATTSEDVGFDDMLPAAIDIIIETGQGSVSFLQRRLKLGYARAARLMDLMEERGIVGPTEGAKPRKILVSKAQWDELKAKDN